MTEILATKPLTDALLTQIVARTSLLEKAPELHIVLVGENPASHLYVKRKQKSATQVGIKSTLHCLPEDISQHALNELMTSLSKEHDVTGILLQLPLPRHLNTHKALNLIPSQKDVDGLTAANTKHLSTQNRHLMPATPLGIMRILAWTNFELTHAHTVVLGESHLVGAPTAKLLTSAGANVTTFNSSSDLTVKHDAMIKADLIVSAAGCLDLVTPENTSPQTTIIDVGINKTPDGTLVGDSNKLEGHVAALTPVPGGVGPMTVVSLLTNIMDAAAWQTGEPFINWDIPIRQS